MWQFERLCVCAYWRCGNQAMRWSIINRRVRQAAPVLLLVMMIWSIGVTFAQTPTPGPDSATTGLLTMKVHADPQQAPLNETVMVEIRLQGDSSQCRQTEVIKPVDAFLVIDRSGSMKGNKIEQAKRAAAAFVDKMDPSSDRVGVVVFDDTAEVAAPVSNDFSQVKEAIKAIGIGGGTNIAKGLQQAYDELRRNRRPDVVPVIIVLSDGQSDVAAMNRVAEAIKEEGFVIVSVGLGSDVEQNAMQGIASQGGDGNPLYYFTPDASQLSEIYRAIARAIRRYNLATNLQLDVQVDIYQYQILSDTLQPAGKVAADSISWQQAVLPGGDHTFSFQVRGRNPGEFPVITSIRARFRECEQEDKELVLEGIPAVKVLSRRTDLPILPVMCAPWQRYPWWLLAPLLMLPVLAVLSTMPVGKRFRRKWPSKGLWCKILLISLLLTLLTVSALLARALMGDLCRVPQIYFWKITAGGKDVGVFSATFDAQQFTPVHVLNQRSGCVACHQVSPQQNIAAVRGEQNGPIVAIRHDGVGVPLPNVRASYLAWSPDGQSLALSFNDTDIYILDVQSGTLRPLPGASEPGIVETMPAWAPDGKTIAFVRASRTAPPPDTAKLLDSCDIYTVPAEGGQATPLPGASGGGFNYYPAYSPDGRWLAFTRHLNGQSTYADEAADIYIIPAGGGQTPVRLSINSEYVDSWPSWSLDSQWLGFASNRFGGQFDILVAPIGENGLPYQMVYDDQGNRSDVFKVPSASLEQDSEFHPVWLAYREDSSTQRVLSLWPWLIPLLLLPFLVWISCREPEYPVEVDVIDGLTGEPINDANVMFIPERDE